MLKDHLFNLSKMEYYNWRKILEEKEYSVLYFDTVKSEDLQAILSPITKFLYNACKTACNTVFTGNISHFLGFLGEMMRPDLQKPWALRKVTEIKETFSLNILSATECTSPSEATI